MRSQGAGSPTSSRWGTQDEAAAPKHRQGAWSPSPRESWWLHTTETGLRCEVLHTLLLGAGPTGTVALQELFISVVNGTYWYLCQVGLLATSHGCYAKSGAGFIARFHFWFDTKEDDTFGALSLFLLLPAIATPNCEPWARRPIREAKAFLSDSASWCQRHFYLS